MAENRDLANLSLLSIHELEFGLRFDIGERNEKKGALRELFGTNRPEVIESTARRREPVRRNLPY